MGNGGSHYATGAMRFSCLVRRLIFVGPLEQVHLKTSWSARAGGSTMTKGVKEDDEVLRSAESKKKKKFGG